MKYMLAILLLFSHLSYSEETYFDGGSVKVGIGYGVKLREVGDSYDEYQNYDLSLGYFVEDNFLLEIGVSDLKVDLSENVEYAIAPFLRSKYFVPISDLSSLYFGASGVLNTNVEPAVNFGFTYDLNSNWYFDLGYQALFSRRDNNVYSILLSMNYRKPYVKPHSNNTLEDNYIDKLAITSGAIDNSVRHKEKPSYYKAYIVMPNDNLTKISKKLSIPLSVVVLSNPQLALMRNSIDLIYPGERVFYPRTWNYGSSRR